VQALPPLPTAVAFRNASDGVLGTTRDIEVTRDGGRTWRVVFRTPRPVSWIGYDPSGRPRAILDDGENLGGPRWRPELQLAQEFSPCVRSRTVFSGSWVLCIGQGSAGTGGKWAYRTTDRGWRRCGALPIAGYALGIAMAPDGFGLVWESRGTVYVTRDRCAHWIGQGSVAVPEVDFGVSGAAVTGGVGWMLLTRNGAVRLLQTTDHGRTWRSMHRWR
jgi:photosystem II stability/assembly factor-like uncharacterized protein